MKMFKEYVEKSKSTRTVYSHLIGDLQESLKLQSSQENEISLMEAKLLFQETKAFKDIPPLT